ncbi:MAG: UbiD family decarboxylase [Deltaproteobacteria bacterium]|nr:UbiD family decarboxylase [Deltaproteobacteria bacterium]
MGPRTNKTRQDSCETGPSLRTWLAQLEAAGQLRRITAPVDGDQEIGAVTRINLGLGGPALLFENIRGHEKGRCTKFLTGALGNKAQLCALLGLASDTRDGDVVRHLRRVFREPVTPKLVPTGPVKENVLRGDQIDLREFPAPRWHHLDGGRFLDTFCGVVTKDPESGGTNVGIYRGQILGRDKVGKLLIPTQHWGGHFLQHARSREPMPVAVVHGWHDVLPFCAGSPFPKGVCEWDMMGAILGRPVQLTKCETVPLEVPASAEIVVEGFVSPDPADFEVEGPFGEYPGYLVGAASPKPVLRVTCITHRNEPILRGALEGARPGFPSEDSMLCAYGWSAIAWNTLDAFGVAGVTDVWMPPVVTGTNIVVQIRKAYRGHAQQVANALWGTSAGQWFYKNVMVVVEVIDFRDREALEWAFAFRVNAGEGQLLTFGPTFGSVLDPSTPRAQADPRKYGTGRWTRVLIDATRNWEFEPDPGAGGRRFPPVSKLPPELEKRVRERWEEYGIGIDYLSEEKRELLTFEKLSKVLGEV